VFGEIEGVKPGSQFQSREALARAGIHKPTQAGISGSIKECADSIVVSGGYEDDDDKGDVIIYTGEGGKDPNSNKQIRDQILAGRNLALARNITTGQPVRVTRSIKVGYQYDGLFNVTDYWIKNGKSGHKVIQYRLEKNYPLPSDLDDGKDNKVITLPTGNQKPETKSSWVSRTIRDTAVGEAIKKLHNFRCQVCKIELRTTVGLYAEAAHIKPLGKPHYGPDTPDNVICLCPNHHLLFDRKAFSINDDYSLTGVSGNLTTIPQHQISPEYLKYHRDQYAGNPIE
jgi:putative restriction endonuclease